MICGHCSEPHNNVYHNAVDEVRNCWREVQQYRLKFSVTLSQTGLDKDKEFRMTTRRIMVDGGW